MVEFFLNLLYKFNLLTEESQIVIIGAIVIFAIILIIGIAKKAIKTIILGVICLILSSMLFVVKTNFIDANNLKLTKTSISNGEATIDYADITNLEVEGDKYLIIKSDEESMELDLGSNYAEAVKSLLEGVIEDSKEALSQEKE